jgi:predicted PurR-regulated permease PerM
MQTESKQPENGAKDAGRNGGLTTVHANILFAFAIGLALFFAYEVRTILLLVYVSALFAVVLMPVIQGIMQLKFGKRSPGRGLSIFLLLLLVAGSATVFFAFAIPPVVHDLQEFTKVLPSRGPEMLSRLRNLPFSSHLDIGALNAKVQGYASNLAEYVLLSVSAWAGGLLDIITTIVLTVYFMLEGDIAYRWVLSLFPREIRTRLDDTLKIAKARMGRWLLAQGLLMLILGVASTIAFVLLKIRYAYALGVLMGVLNIIPVVGAMVSMALVLLVAAVDSGGKALAALIFYLVYAQIENSYLTPRIMQTHVDLAGLAVLIALLLGSKLGGIAGAMVAVPTAVLLAVLIQEYLVQNDPLVRLAEKMS